MSMVLFRGVYWEGTEIMIKGQVKPIYLLITVLFLLSACGQQAVIQLPPDDPTAIPAIEAQPTDPPEEESEPVEIGLGDLLKAGTAMKWYDDGYLVFVTQGEVTLGDNEYENNLVHNVLLDDYWIYMFKVTNGQYRQCIATGACTPPANEAPYPDLNDPEIKDKPVIGVTWEQADTYCEWMNGRLPTKAEWEKAARGPQSNTYPWGEDEPTCDLLNYGECEDPEITMVYEYPEGRSFYQAFDLAGNTFEWVFDLYEDDFISQLPFEYPAGPPDGTERSVRGSSYVSGEELIPSAQLYYLEPEKYRADLGFRCVIGEGQPEAFASPCIQTAYIPGDPPAWQPGPQPGNPWLDIQMGLCLTDIGVKHTTYCSNPSLQQGGLDLSIAAVGSDDVYVNSWSSPQAVACIDGTDPLQCFGPELAPVTFEICATCTPALQVEQIPFYCDSGYTLSDTNPPTCIYNGTPPQPGQTCPAGFVYDPVDDICVKVVIQNEECPLGYEYNPGTDCCTATYGEPTSQDPGTPSSSYLTCPPGYANVPLMGWWVVQGQDYATCQYLVISPQMENCITRTFNLGECREVKPKCKNPSSYTTPSSCEAAACKWEKGATGGPIGGTCVSP